MELNYLLKRNKQNHDILKLNISVWMASKQVFLFITNRIVLFGQRAFAGALGSRAERWSGWTRWPPSGSNPWGRCWATTETSNSLRRRRKRKWQNNQDRFHLWKKTFWVTHWLQTASAIINWNSHKIIYNSIFFNPSPTRAFSRCAPSWFLN